MLFLIREHLVALLGFALGLALILHILRQQNRPAVSIAWMMAIVLIPYLGVPAYLVLGGRKLARQAGRKRHLYDGTSATPGAEAAADTTLQKLLRLSGMPPARAHNRINLVDNGEQAYAALYRLLEEARESIHLMIFILSNDAVGRSIVELLARKAREGVPVRLLVDALGCFYSRPGIVRPLRRAGVHVGVFMPVLPLRRRWSANLRNHRKIVVVDGKAGMVGGMNIAYEYMGPEPDPERWIDTCALVEGPIVADLDDIFASDWHFATGEPLELSKTPEELALPGIGEAVAQVVASGPDVAGDPMYEAILSSTYEAHQRIWIVTPYFIPDEGLLQALLLKARLGLDVRLLMPKTSNHFMADLARGRFLRQLRAAGARVLLCERGMIHAKHIIFDNTAAIAGSANLDMRSLYLNYEDAIFLYSPREIAQIEDWMTAYMAEAAEMRTAEINAWRRWAEDIGLLVSPLL